MIRLKTLLRQIIGIHSFEKLAKVKSDIINLNRLIFNYYNDARLFLLHSMVFRQDTFNKIESRIILHYHGLEKGFLHKKFKFRYGVTRVVELIKLLKHKDVIIKSTYSQIAAAYLVICKYYEKHESNDVDISDYYKKEDYIYFKKLSTLNLEVIKSHYKSSFYRNCNSNFLDFSNSRVSVRNFTGAKIPLDRLNKVIELAKNAPSVCNRQPTKVYYVENKEIISRILTIQGGMRGYTNEITQLLILTTDRNYFFSIGERNQLFIDGGIFCMNLLYALHFYKIGACPAHWGFNFKHDKIIRGILSISISEKVICLIPIGEVKTEFSTTLSLRRNNEEILKVID